MNWKKIIGLILALAVIAAMVIRLKNNKLEYQESLGTTKAVSEKFSTVQSVSVSPR